MIIINNNPAHNAYLSESERLASFTKWTKSEISINVLAKFGWYFTGYQDTVKCPFCYVTKSHWIIGDHPLVVHIQKSPGCPLFIRKSRNKPLQANFDEQLPSITNIVKSNTGALIIKLTGFDAIKHPDYRTYISRYTSFEDWPKSLKPTPHELSDAGFFYLNKSDHVKCFCCGGQIENWNRDWDAWEQHVHRFENCQYVQLCKTKEFIEYVDAKFSGKIFQISKKDVATKRISIRTCSLCGNNDLNCIFLPCSHICTCIKCGFSVTHCPLCQTKIDEVKNCYIV